MINIIDNHNVRDIIVLINAAKDSLEWESLCNEQKIKWVREFYTEYKHGKGNKMSKIKRLETMEMYLDDGANMPVRGHDLDAGLDLKTKERVVIPAHGSEIIDTGIHFKIPKGWFGKLESKSGLNVMKQVFCAGGVIDAGYTGSIKCRLYNFSDEDYVFEENEKCVQIVFLPISTPDLIEIHSMEDWEYERGNAGFGSTGK